MSNLMLGKCQVNQKYKQTERANVGKSQTKKANNNRSMDKRPGKCTYKCGKNWR